MLSLSPAAALRPADPAARGSIASHQQQKSLPQASTSSRGILSHSSAAPFRSADSAARGAMAAQKQSFRMREFDYFVVIDFEATCKEGPRIYPQEIIEFPAVLVDAVTGDLLSAFRTYVKPRHHPVLTAFCKELTGIQQEQVDGGVELAEALAMHDSWLAAAGVAKNRLAVVTWGDWDCKAMLEFECTFKGIAKPAYFDRWVNLRIPFEAAFGAGRRNLQEAVREAGLQWDGRLHCGLDDARNTARLLVEVMSRGVPITITGSLVPVPLPEPEPEPEPKPKPKPEIQIQPLAAPLNHCLNWCACGAGFCYCSVPIRGNMVMMPGETQGRYFFTCGNWTPSLGPMCPFFVWAA
ncbi:unnamed protein product [Urochloa decumbens]|uniref:GRF-type domain-containing protein n=1 Tax=Urochloa decumbens TaxID=240449 RepID=A0ABC9FQ18_9POAL